MASRWAMTSVVRPCHQPVESGLDLALAFRIERGGRLVEKQDRRILQDRPGNRETLALAARQGHAALADEGVVALRHGPDEAVGGRQRRRRGAISSSVASWRP